jgi:hypothetical protein
MAGEKGRSGRPNGRTSWWRNPVALAGHDLNGLIEHWLAGAPIRIGDGWLEGPNERRSTVPPKIKRVLAIMAIEQVMEAHADAAAQDSAADVVCSVALKLGVPVHVIRAQQLRDARGHPKFKRPNVKDVLAWSRRHAPSVTLRRERRRNHDERRDAFEEYVRELETGWRVRDCSGESPEQA